MKGRNKWEIRGKKSEDAERERRNVDDVKQGHKYRYE